MRHHTVPRYRSMRYHVMKELSEHLNKDLWYHGIHHTRDVLKVCNGYIRRRKMGKRDALVLRTAAVLHDYGFLVTYRNHEEEGCRTARKILPDYGYPNKMIEEVCGLIMATKIPQSPKTKLERMLCDADLDYLGRSDFDEIAESLFRELKAMTGLESRVEWNKIQFSFLSKHQFLTQYALKYRAPQKDLNLKKIQEWLAVHAPDYSG